MNEEERLIVNNSDDENSSCGSIPEEFEHSPTVPHSPTDSRRRSEMHLETTTSANPKEKTESKRTSKNFNDSNFGTKADIYEKLRCSINNSKGDSVKKIMQN